MLYVTAMLLNCSYVTYCHEFYLSFDHDKCYFSSVVTAEVLIHDESYWSSVVTAELLIHDESYWSSVVTAEVLIHDES